MSDQLRYIERKVEEVIGQRANDGLPINRSDLTEVFGFSALSASNHIKRFMKRFPGFLTYDESRKAYYRTVTQ